MIYQSRVQHHDVTPRLFTVIKVSPFINCPSDEPYLTSTQVDYKSNCASKTHMRSICAHIDIELIIVFIRPNPAVRTDGHNYNTVNNALLIEPIK